MEQETEPTKKQKQVIPHDKEILKALENIHNNEKVVSNGTTVPEAEKVSVGGMDLKGKKPTKTKAKKSVQPDPEEDDEEPQPPKQKKHTTSKNGNHKIRRKPLGDAETEKKREQWRKSYETHKEKYLTVWSMSWRKSHPKEFAAYQKEQAKKKAAKAKQKKAAKSSE